MKVSASKIYGTATWKRLGSLLVLAMMLSAYILPQALAASIPTVYERHPPSLQESPIIYAGSWFASEAMQGFIAITAANAVVLTLEVFYEEYPGALGAPLTVKVSIGSTPTIQVSYYYNNVYLASLTVTVGITANNSLLLGVSNLNVNNNLPSNLTWLKEPRISKDELHKLGVELSNVTLYLGEIIGALGHPQPVEKANATVLGTGVTLLYYGDYTGRAGRDLLNATLALLPVIGNLTVVLPKSAVVAVPLDNAYGSNAMYRALIGALANISQGFLLVSPECFTGGTTNYVLPCNVKLLASSVKDTVSAPLYAILVGLALSKRIVLQVEPTALGIIGRPYNETFYQDPILEASSPSMYNAYAAIIRAGLNLFKNTTGMQGGLGKPGSLLESLAVNITSGNETKALQALAEAENLLSQGKISKSEYQALLDLYANVYGYVPSQYALNEDQGNATIIDLNRILEKINNINSRELYNTPQTGLHPGLPQKPKTGRISSLISSVSKNFKANARLVLALILIPLTLLGVLRYASQLDMTGPVGVARLLAGKPPAFAEGRRASAWCYWMLVYLLALKGYPKWEWETPREYLGRVRGLLPPEVSSLLEDVTRVFEDSFYGGRNPDPEWTVSCTRRLRGLLVPWRLRRGG